MSNLMFMALWAALGSGAILLIVVLYVLGLRRIVQPDQVHVVQRNKNSEVYGSAAKDNSGNTYYEFPSWIPRLGVTVKILPTDIFDIDLNDYEAYDKDRLQFLVDIKAFFRIVDFKVAAVKIKSTQSLSLQLKSIVQGAVRSLLAKEDLESIMSERAKYGTMFTEEICEQLKEWGVATVKNIELMDIRDAHGSDTIANIMKKKKSAIEAESRKTVAGNIQQAKEAEIVAMQIVQLKEQDAKREVGLREAAVQQEVGIANEKAAQEIQAQKKTTAEKEMEVTRVNTIKAAEIDKDAAEVQAEQNRKVTIIDAETRVKRAEADKQATILTAEAEKEKTILEAEATKQRVELKAQADLTTSVNEAKGIEAKGKATAESERLNKTASVADKVTLAKEIGENKPYQEFLLKQKQVEVMGEVGVAQAKNLSGANLNVYATAGSVTDGISKAANIFSPSNTLDIASGLEAFVATPFGAAVADKVLGTGDAVKTLETAKQVVKNPKGDK
jgi:flotillin